MGSASSSYRVIYLDVDGRIQKVVFSRFCSPCDIKELFCTALGVPRNTNLSLLDSSGAMVSIDPTMPHNTERSPYRVVPVTSGQLADKEELFQNVLTQVAEQFSRAFKINELKTEVTNRLAMLEKRVELEGMKVVEIEKCRNDIKKLREEMASRNNSNFLEDNKKLTPRRDVPSYPKYHLSKETVEALRLPTFDAWQWEPNEMLSCLEHMYHDLGLVKDFNINPITLKRWLLCIHDNYRNNPFHNFRHCFCVTQMMYSMICLCSLQEKFTQVDILILMTAAVCHDLDHPGFNNTYQINARTELAVRYNDISPLENHHCAVAFQIFSQPDCNIFSNFDPEAFKQIRQGTITWTTNRQIPVRSVAGSRACYLARCDGSNGTTIMLSPLPDMLLVLLTVSTLFLGSSADIHEVCYGKNFSLPSNVVPPLYKGPLILMPSRGGATRTMMDNGMAIEPRIKISHASATLTDVTEQDEGIYMIEPPGQPQYSPFILKVLDCAEVRHYTKRVDEYLIIEYPWDNGVWLVNYQPKGKTDNITLIKDGLKQLEEWFDWRLEIQSAGIKIDALEIKDSGTFEFRDKKSNLVLAAHLEMKDKQDDDPPPPPLLLVYISVAFLLGGLVCCWFTRNMKCWKKCCRREKSAPQPAAPPAAHYQSESQSVAPSYSAVPSSSAQPENELKNPTADTHA